MCCSRLAANMGRKKVAKNRHLGTIAQLCRAISSQLRHVLTIGKNLLSSNISSTCPWCPHNMVNVGPVAAEILSLVWGTPANFNGFRVLAALLHGTLVVSVSQTVALNKGRHLYLAGRPSRWALAHISSFVNFLWKDSRLLKWAAQALEAYSSGEQTEHVHAGTAINVKYVIILTTATLLTVVAACNQRLYLLAQLKTKVLVYVLSALDSVFKAIVLNKILYALTVYFGYLTA